MHYHPVAIGFEWIGTFFLAVEAIKLENLAILRVKLRRASFFADRPLRKMGRGAAIPIAVFASIGAVAAHFALALFDVSSIDLVRRTFVTAVNFEPPIGYICWVLSLAPLVILLSYIGYLTYLTPFTLLLVPIIVLRAIERNVANGIVGIMGFLCFSVYAVMMLLNE